MKKLLFLFISIAVLGTVLFLVFANSRKATVTEEPKAPVVEGSTLLSSPLSTDISPQAVTLRSQIKDQIKSGAISTEQLFDENVRLIDEFPKREAPSVVTDYSTVYFVDTDSLLISLFAFPLAETRLRAEKYLLEKLHITQSDACSLNIEVKVNSSVSATLANQNLGLSFCPGSTDLSSYKENVDGVSNIQE